MMRQINIYYFTTSGLFFSTTLLKYNHNVINKNTVKQENHSGMGGKLALKCSKKCAIGDKVRNCKTASIFSKNVQEQT